MKNILIPTDFSENAENALNYAQVLFSEISCNFYLLHVDAPLNPLNKNITKNNESDSRVLLSRLQIKSKNQYHNEKHFFHTINDHGFFIEAIKKQLNEKLIDLIVLGTKGATDIMGKVVGSNAGDIITKVQCNALIIPKDVVFSKPSEIAFPTDFNIFYAHGILSSITEMLQLNSGNMRIMNVIKKGMQLNQEQKKNKEYLSDFMEESFFGNYSFHTLSNTKIKTAIQCFVESRDIDMIIMVAKNLNFIQQILFDSIVESISFHTTVPFYVIHE